MVSWILLYDIISPILKIYLNFVLFLNKLTSHVSDFTINFEFNDLEFR